MIKLTESINCLSSGTIATLIKESNYSIVEEEKNKFYEFAKDLPQNITWQKAWKIYINK